MHEKHEPAKSSFRKCTLRNPSGTTPKSRIRIISIQAGSLCEAIRSAEVLPFLQGQKLLFLHLFKRKVKLDGSFFLFNRMNIDEAGSQKATTHQVRRQTRHVLYSLRPILSFPSYCRIGDFHLFHIFAFTIGIRDLAHIVGDEKEDLSEPFSCINFCRQGSCI